MCLDDTALPFALDDVPTVRGSGAVNSAITGTSSRPMRNVHDDEEAVEFLG
jgi:hypothetical protein